MDHLELMMQYQIPEIYDHIRKLDVNIFLKKYISNYYYCFCVSCLLLPCFVNIFLLLCFITVLRSLGKEFWIYFCFKGLI